MTRLNEISTAGAPVGGRPVSVPAREVLTLQNVGKVYLTEDVETHALYDVSLSVQPGEWIAIVGPSGSGKSTLLSVIGLLEAPSSGSYVLEGEAVSELPPAARARVRNEKIGFIFQSFNLIHDLSVYENVELPLIYRRVPHSERRERTERALERLSMTHRAKHFPAQLSGGQQQRVAVARALVGGPLLLLADEPTGNLDSKNGQLVIELLKELNAAGSTICMVTHDPAHARAATRRIALLDGRLESQS